MSGQISVMSEMILTETFYNTVHCCVPLFPEGGAVGLSVEERRRTVAELQAVFKATGFPFHIVPLEQVSVDAAVCYTSTNAGKSVNSGQD